MFVIFSAAGFPSGSRANRTAIALRRRSCPGAAADTARAGKVFRNGSAGDPSSRDWLHPAVRPPSWSQTPACGSS